MTTGVIVFIVVYVLAVTTALAGLSAAPWLPTKKKEREIVAEVLPLRGGDVFYDLGCGDGSVLFTMAERYPEAKLIGFEIAVLPYLIGRLRLLLGGRRYRRVEIRYSDLFKQDLSDAAAVFCFLMSKSYDRLRQKFARELADDCPVMIEAWPFPGIDPIKRIKESKALSLFLYKGSQFR